MTLSLGDSPVTSHCPTTTQTVSVLPEFGVPESVDTLQREDFSEYVAHLQLHMALQTRNLLPTLSEIEDGRNQLLVQTQAHVEKQVSRQIF
jgi:hypothetical protein